MDNITFRDSPPPSVEQPKSEVIPPDLNKPVSGETDDEPVELRDKEGRSVVLDALGINEDVSSLTMSDKENLTEVKDYVMSIVKAKGLSPTVSVFNKTLDSLRTDMGLESESEPSIVLDRIAGVVKAWRNISFVKDPAEKKRIFFKLAKLNSSEEMNREVFKIMEDKSVWL